MSVLRITERELVASPIAPELHVYGALWAVGKTTRDVAESYREPSSGDLVLHLREPEPETEKDRA